MFNPTNLDEVCGQATHLEVRRKNVQEEGKKKPFQSGEKGKKFKGKNKKMIMLRKKGRNPCVGIVPRRVMMKHIAGRFILNYDRINLTTKGNRKPTLLYNKTWVYTEEMKQKSQPQSPR